MAGLRSLVIERYPGFGLVLLLVLILAVSHPSASRAAACPPLIDNATRLFVAVAPGMSSPTGTAQLYRRDGASDPWQLSGARLPVTFGRNGLGWSFDQTGFAKTGGNLAVPVKVEGDGRTPAGLFAAGDPFGFADRKLRNYIKIGAETICVEDPDSPFYNQVVTQKAVPKTAGHENMREISLYRAGMIIKNPTNRAARGGSCIFLHVWRAKGRPTSGCVAMSEPNVVRVQELFDGEPAALALLPQTSLAILSQCGLPGRDNPGN